MIEGSLRPDLVVLDDIEDEELVRSESRRLDLEIWFNGAVMPTIEPTTGQIIIVGTILHMDSLLNRMVAQNLYPEFETKIYSAINEDTNEALWPERFSLQDLEKKKEDAIARGQLPQFYMEYQNNPIPQEAAEFKHEYLNYYKLEDLPDNLCVELFMDSGGGSVKKRADDTAIVVTGTDQSY